MIVTPAYRQATRSGQPGCYKRHNEWHTTNVIELYRRVVTEVACQQHHPPRIALVLADGATQADIPSTLTTLRYYSFPAEAKQLVVWLKRFVRETPQPPPSRRAGVDSSDYSQSLPVYRQRGIAGAAADTMTTISA